MKYLAAADTYNYVNKSTSKIKVFPRISVISEVKINQEKETKRRKKERKSLRHVTLVSAEQLTAGRFSTISRSSDATLPLLHLEKSRQKTTIHLLERRKRNIK